MLSKKQRKSSRFYNTIKRKASLTGMNAITKWRVDTGRMMRARAETARWNKSADPACIPSIHWNRERQVPKPSPIRSLIPRSARAILNFIKGIAA